MSAPLTVLVTLVLLAASAAALNLFQYKTEVVKGASCGTENKQLGPFFIPNNQCSGVLYNLTQHCERLELVKVSVTDYAHVKVTIDDSLSSVSIERSPNLVSTCPGRAAVRAVLGCGLHSSDEVSLAGAPSGLDSALPPM
ncbi:hypothetical protein RR46_03594 [Papilio xuthus]|uniref:Uncharacterized protein n=1 Tax=Papilio xuthus TaxID=66420 RepID=A0A194PYN1_PAPXU|nr:hypothetical protein RR46_03594 [Papilio xuthus]